MERGRMVKSRRLRTASDFARVRHSGRSYATARLVLVAARQGSTPDFAQLPIATRVGFSVGKRVGNAVERNRVRRRLREMMRSRLGQLAPGWDLVMGARAPAAATSFSALEDELEELLARAKVLATGSEARPL